MCWFVVGLVPQHIATSTRIASAFALRGSSWAGCHQTIQKICRQCIPLLVYSLSLPPPSLPLLSGHLGMLLSPCKHHTTVEQRISHGHVQGMRQAACTPSCALARGAHRLEALHRWARGACACSVILPGTSSCLPCCLVHSNPRRYRLCQRVEALALAPPLE